MTLGQLKHLDNGTTEFDEEDRVIDGYLALVKKGKVIDDVVCPPFYLIELPQFIRRLDLDADQDVKERVHSHTLQV